MTYEFAKYPDGTLVYFQILKKKENGYPELKEVE